MSPIIKKFLQTIDFKKNNEKYIRSQISKLLKTFNKDNFNSIDVGSHTGEVMKIILQHSPNGYHWGFEPIVELFEIVRNKYGSVKCQILNLAICDSKDERIFSYIRNEPTLSGFNDNKLMVDGLENWKLLVNTDTLDNVIPKKHKIEFINIDVEGAELLVLKGAENLIKRDSPIILFEHKPETSVTYNTTLSDYYDFFVNKHSYSLYSLNSYLANKKSSNLDELQKLFKQSNVRYFIAAK